MAKFKKKEVGNMAYTAIIHPAEEGGFWPKLRRFQGVSPREKRWKRFLKTLKKLSNLI
jgi:hypothetical protein